MQQKESMKVKVKKEAVEAINFELEEASLNEEDVDNPSTEQETLERQPGSEKDGSNIENRASRLAAVGKAREAAEQARISKPPLVAAKELPGRVEVVKTTTRVENKEKLSRVEVVRKVDPQVVARLPAAKEVVRRVAVDRVHNCVLCNDKDGRSMNLGSGLWDIKYHYAMSNIIGIHHNSL